MNKDQLMKIWQDFSAKNEFMLNPENKIVDGVAEGVLQNEKEYGLKLCPCRLRDGTYERDMELICPCNFKIHSTWQTQGRCWCGLFVKRK